MASCCRCLGKSANIVFCFLLFVIGGFVAGMGIWYLVSDYDDWVPEWWVWIAIVAGILVALLSFVGCYGSLKQNKCVLSFLWVAATVLFVLFAIAAIASTIFFTGTDNLKGMTSKELNEVSGNDETVYKQIRNGYIAVFTGDDCNVDCNISGDELSCGSITCETEEIEDRLDGWIGPHWWTTDVATFKVCVASAVEDDQDETAAEAWCASNTYAIKWFWDWALGTMIVLWVIVAFTLFMAIGNCVLMWSHSQRKAVVVSPKTDWALSVGIDGGAVTYWHRFNEQKKCTSIRKATFMTPWAAMASVPYCAILASMEIRDLSEDKSPSSTSPRQIGILLYNALVFAAGGAPDASLVCLDCPVHGICYDDTVGG
ncbi:hypothetical protein FOZ62_032224 [Perkinsus olseni]|uniref:Uncharacterized protein n=1 Tax=Perkinsus olseni TaxID=32597 RepID=A0A7J6SQS2_PEROL|nr:hypothetical protein FOZ62_032224 [Perkinsus olseni]